MAGLKKPWNNQAVGSQPFSGLKVIFLWGRTGTESHMNRYKLLYSLLCAPRCFQPNNNYCCYYRSHYSSQMTSYRAPCMALHWESPPQPFIDYEIFNVGDSTLKIQFSNTSIPSASLRGNTIASSSRPLFFWRVVKLLFSLIYRVCS